MGGRGGVEGDSYCLMGAVSFGEDEKILETDDSNGYMTL